MPFSPILSPQLSLLSGVCRPLAGSFQIGVEPYSAKAERAQ